MPINKALAEYLELYHKGEANAVTSRELECAFRMRGSELRREINALRSAACPAPCLTMRTPVSSPSRWREVTLLEQLYSLGRRQGQAAVDHQ